VGKNRSLDIRLNKAAKLRNKLTVAVYVGRFSFQKVKYSVQRKYFVLKPFLTSQLLLPKPLEK